MGLRKAFGMFFEPCLRSFMLIGVRTEYRSLVEPLCDVTQHVTVAVGTLAIDGRRPELKVIPVDVGVAQQLQVLLGDGELIPLHHVVEVSLGDAPSGEGGHAVTVPLPWGMGQVHEEGPPSPRRAFFYQHQHTNQTVMCAASLQVELAVANTIEEGVPLRLGERGEAQLRLATVTNLDLFVYLADLDASAVGVALAALAPVLIECHAAGPTVARCCPRHCPGRSRSTARRRCSRWRSRTGRCRTDCC